MHCSFSCIQEQIEFTGQIQFDCVAFACQLYTNVYLSVSLQHWQFHRHRNSQSDKAIRDKDVTKCHEVPPTINFDLHVSLHYSSKASIAKISRVTKCIHSCHSNSPSMIVSLLHQPNSRIISARSHKMGQIEQICIANFEQNHARAM